MQSNAEFEELAVPLFDALYNFAFWLTFDRSDAEDLVQETFAKALKGFSSFQPGTNFKAWLFQILKNTFLTSKTGLASRRTISLEDEGAAAVHTLDRSTPESIFLANASSAKVQAEIEQLPLPYREVLLLADLEEMKYAEIAEVLRLPIGTVMSRLSRARQRLRQGLAADAGMHSKY